MNAPSKDIKTMLAADSSLALTFGTNLFISEMPSEPDECVCIYDTGGMDPEIDYTYLRPTVQVRVRSEGYSNAYALAEDIRDLLHGSTGEEHSGARYVGIWCMGDILFVGYDELHRAQLTINFRINRTTA